MDWTAIPVLVEDNIVLDEYLGKGAQPGEELLPEEETAAAGENVQFSNSLRRSLT
jgi:hypothetical protein